MEYDCVVWCKFSFLIFTGHTQIQTDSPELVSARGFMAIPFFLPASLYPVYYSP